MQIAQSPNFEARKILTVNQVMNKKSSNNPSCIEVFSLKKDEDANFARKCYAVLKTKHTRCLTPMQKKLKNFFKDFLGNKSTATENYYLAVKDAEIISGGMVTNVFGGKNLVNQSFSTYPKISNLDAIFYAVLTDSKIKYKNYPVVNIADLKIVDYEIPSEDINCYKNKIKALYPNFIYMNNCMEHVDLEELLGINDIELDVII